MNMDEDKLEFRKITKENYMECIALKVDESQKHFVADNAQSLVEAAFEDGLYTLAIYHNRTMVGFILYDYDEDIPGWSLSRFMIGKQYQGKGCGKRAVLEFLDFFRKNYDADKIYISVSLENVVARKCMAILGLGKLRK